MSVTATTTPDSLITSPPNGKWIEDWRPEDPASSSAAANSAGVA